MSSNSSSVHGISHKLPRKITTFEVKEEEVKLASMKEKEKNGEREGREEKRDWHGQTLLGLNPLVRTYVRKDDDEAVIISAALPLYTIHANWLA